MALLSNIAPHGVCVLDAPTTHSQTKERRRVRMTTTTTRSLKHPSSTPIRKNTEDRKKQSRHDGLCECFKLECISVGCPASLFDYIWYLAMPRQKKKNISRQKYVCPRHATLRTSTHHRRNTKTQTPAPLQPSATPSTVSKGRITQKYRRTPPGVFCEVRSNKGSP